MAEFAPNAFERLLDRMPYGVALVANGLYVHVNHAWAKQLGAEPASFEGRTILEDIHEGDRSLMTDWLASSTPSADEDGAEYRFLRPDGEMIALEVQPIDPSDMGTRVTHAFVSRDITLLRKLQARLLLADRMQSVGALAAGVAHEINNPLAYVIGNLSFIGEVFDELIENAPPDDKKDLLDAFTEATEGASRVAKIVSNLLAFSRADQDGPRLISVTGAIESAIAMAWPEIRLRARLEKRLGNVPSVKVNESQLAQVVLNLLLNAAHALPLGHAEEHEIRVSTFVSPDGEVVIELADTGPGIPAELLGHVFDTFFTTKPIGVGTGLGLSIAKSIVTEMEGHIDVESELGHGAKFSVYLPAFRGDVDSPDVPDIGEAPTRRGRIMIIDDEPYLGRSVARTLKGHTLWTVTSGREAIELLEDRNVEPDLILCDLYMPDLSGIDVYQWIETNRNELLRRVVFLTGGGRQASLVDFLARVDNFQIRKPFDVDALRKFVAEQLEVLWQSQHKPTS